MSRDGYLPAGCTQREIDEALQGPYEVECAVCAGSGLVFYVDGLPTPSVGEEEGCQECPACDGLGIEAR